MKIWHHTSFYTSLHGRQAGRHPLSIKRTHGSGRSAWCSTKCHPTEDSTRLQTELPPQPNGTKLGCVLMYHCHGFSLSPHNQIGMKIKLNECNMEKVNELMSGLCSWNDLMTCQLYVNSNHIVAHGDCPNIFDRGHGIVYIGDGTVGPVNESHSSSGISTQSQTPNITLTLVEW